MYNHVVGCSTDCSTEPVTCAGSPVYLYDMVTWSIHYRSGFPVKFRFTSNTTTSGTMLYLVSSSEILKIEFQAERKVTLASCN